MKPDRQSRWRPGTVIAVVLFAGLVAVVLWQFLQEDHLESSSSLTSLAAGSTSEGSIAEAGFSPADIGRQFGDSVLKVESDGCDLAVVGSGFVVGDGIVLTNRHVVANDETPQLVDRTGATYESRVIGWSEDPDVALLQVEGLDKPALQWERADQLAEGDQVVIVGYPLPGNDFTVLQGSVTSFVTSGQTRQAFRVDAALDFGNSGGPVLALDGGVVGVATRVEAGGLQVVPIVITWDSIKSTLTQLQAERSLPVAHCTPLPPPFDPEAVWAFAGPPELDGPTTSIWHGDLGPLDPTDEFYGTPTDLYGPGPEMPYQVWEQASNHGFLPLDEAASMYSDVGLGVLPASDPHYGGMFTVLFFYDGAYIGRDTWFPSDDMRIRWWNSDQQAISVEYGLYGPGDGHCCPSVEYEVVYSWDGADVVPDRWIPPGDWNFIYHR
jgi:S1-C subfamily serine protease